LVEYEIGKYSKRKLANTAASFVILYANNEVKNSCHFDLYRWESTSKRAEELKIFDLE
jgi:hypothetical protein